MSEVKLQLEPTNEAPAISRLRLAELRDDLGTRYEDVALVLSELVSNSVRHSGDGAVHVLVRTNSTMVRLEVTDGGPCFERDNPRGDGLGLKIVEKVAYQWGVEPDGSCTVWADVRLD